MGNWALQLSEEGFKKKVPSYFPFFLKTVDLMCEKRN